MVPLVIAAIHGCVEKTSGKHTKNRLKIAIETADLAIKKGWFPIVMWVYRAHLKKIWPIRLGSLGFDLRAAQRVPNEAKSTVSSSMNSRNSSGGREVAWLENVKTWTMSYLDDESMKIWCCPKILRSAWFIILSGWWFGTFFIFQKPHKKLPQKEATPQDVPNKQLKQWRNP